MSTATAIAPQQDSSLRTIRLIRAGLMPVLLIAALVVFSLLSSQFLNPSNLKDIIVNSGDLAMLAAGMTIVILLGGIDISAGPMLGVIAWVIATMMAAGTSPLLVVASALIAGVTLGLLNGSIVVFGRVAPIIATLGTSAIFQSVLFVLWAKKDRFSSPVLPIFSGQTLGGFPILIIPILLVFIALAYVLKRRRFGLHIYAVGNDPEGARLLGVSANKVTMMAYALMGALTGLGSLFYIGRVGVVQAASGADMSIAAIAAVVVGGTSILGGQGGIIRTLGGLLFIAVLQNGVVLAGVPSLWTGAIVGIAVALAVSVDVVTGRIIDKRTGVAK
ncbi:ABC transporter permease [Scrofimicrobium sp. R131]|uniref:Autoinducer 2 import system permease protein LsrC n=1 Tax=Scrofimicrobium appendicitidis TaxID=3079930 RepID=A0AAU7VAY9_9ACTO